jgi:hypothetical protein
LFGRLNSSRRSESRDKEVLEELLEGTMILFDKLLGLKLIGEEDLTDTAWWEEVVFQGLAEDGADEEVEVEDSEPTLTLRSGALN